MSDNTTEDSTGRLITKEFLESVTKLKIESFIVEEGANAGDNYNSVLHTITARVSQSTVDSSGEYETLYFLLKCYPSHPTRQKQQNNSNAFYKELSFYTGLASELVNFQTAIVGLKEDQVIRLGCPPCYGGKAINYAACEPEALTKVYSPLDNFILMTDLRKGLGFKMVAKHIGLDEHHMGVGFFELATMHAVSWAYRKRVNWDIAAVEKYSFLKQAGENERINMWMNILNESVVKVVAVIDAALGKENNVSKSLLNYARHARPAISQFRTQDEATELTLRELLRIPLNKTSSEPGPWRVICHGDMWVNNMLFQYDQVTNKPVRTMLVDFPLVKLGCPTFDLACLVYTSTRKQFRDLHLKKCLELYIERFLEICEKLQVEPLPGLCLETLESKFHVSKLVAFYITIIATPLNLGETGTDADLEKVDSNASFEDMFLQFQGAEKGGSPLYREWMLEVVQELYDQGVI